MLEEVEKTKIDASEKSLTLLSKRLKILESYKINEDKNSSDKNIILSDADDIQNKISSIGVDLQRSNSIKDKSDKLLQSIPENIRSISDNFKSLIGKIKSLLRSQQDEINDVKTKIKDYDSSIVKSNKILDTLISEIKDNDRKKIALEKERIEFKQLIDKIVWKSDELQKTQNDLNISLSSLQSDEVSTHNNISRLDKDKNELEDRKLHLLSNDGTSKKPSTDMQNLLKKLLEKKSKKEKELGTSRTTLSTLDNKISSYESEKNEVNLIISEIREKLESEKISLSEKTAQRDSLKDNSEIPIKEIEKLS